MDALCCPADSADCKISQMTEYVGAAANALTAFASDAEASVDKMLKRVESLEGNNVESAWF
jgi:hypothetical protein